MIFILFYFKFHTENVFNMFTLFLVCVISFHIINDICSSKIGLKLANQKKKSCKKFKDALNLVKMSAGSILNRNKIKQRN